MHGHIAGYPSFTGILLGVCTYRLPPDRVLSTYEARVTSLLLQPSTHPMLWVGLGSGHMLMFNATSQRLLMTTKRHVQSVRCLQLVKTMFAENPVNYVISGGFGFQQRPGYSAPNRGKAGLPATQAFPVIIMQELLKHMAVCWCGIA